MPRYGPGWMPRCGLGYIVWGGPPAAIGDRAQDSVPISVRSAPAPHRTATLEGTMAKTAYTSVDEYIESQPEAVQTVLQRVRRIIRKAVPRAGETISYQIPAYKLPGGPVLYFAGWKEHFSLYPATATLVAEFEDELAPYERSKGAIRFPFSQPVPVKLIERIAKFRAKETAAREKPKPAAKKRR